MVIFHKFVTSYTSTQWRHMSIMVPHITRNQLFVHQLVRVDKRKASQARFIDPLCKRGIHRWSVNSVGSPYSFPAMTSTCVTSATRKVKHVSQILARFIVRVYLFWVAVLSVHGEFDACDPSTHTIQGYNTAIAISTNHVYNSVDVLFSIGVLEP